MTEPSYKNVLYSKNKTITVQIGNSDNKLTQEEWAQFFNDCNDILNNYGNMHFAGTSLPNQKWQNACFVIESMFVDDIVNELRKLSEKYNQDSIAMTVGNTKFVRKID